MKKMFFAFLLLSAMPVMANYYSCGNWGPYWICQAETGDLLDSFVQDKFDKEMALPVDTIEYVVEGADSIEIWKEHIFQDDKGYKSGESCMQSCEIAEASCFSNQVQNGDGACTDVTGGPFLCGSWVTTSGACHPETGEILDAWESTMFQDGWWISHVIDFTEQEQNEITNYREIITKHENGMITTHWCDQSCPVIDECPPGQSPNEISICDDIVQGPYECGDDWSIGKWCEVGTEDLKQHYVDQMLSDGFLFTEENIYTQAYPTKLDYMKVFNYERSATGETGSTYCKKTCPAVNQCADGMATDENGICRESSQPDQPDQNLIYHESTCQNGEVEVPSGCMSSHQYDRQIDRLIRIENAAARLSMLEGRLRPGVYERVKRIFEKILADQEAKLGL